MPIKFADTAKPNNTTTATGKGTFPVAKADDVWFNDGDSLEEKLLNGDLGNSESIQVNELPEANEENQETILQYIGDTDDNYVNGLFYQCIVGTDDNGDIIYKWVEKEVQNSIKVSQEEGNLIILKDDGIFAEQKASSVDCIACDDIGNLEDIIEGQYYYNISDGLIYLIKDGNFTEVNVTADEIEITKELYATLSEEQKNLDVTWFVNDMENPFDTVELDRMVDDRIAVHDEKYKVYVSEKTNIGSNTAVTWTFTETVPAGKYLAHWNMYCTSACAGCVIYTDTVLGELYAQFDKNSSSITTMSADLSVPITINEDTTTLTAGYTWASGVTSSKLFLTRIV